MDTGGVADIADTIPKCIAGHVARFPDRIAYREKEYGIWQSWTWAEAGDAIRNLAMGFMELGLKPGDHVALIGRNRPYFYWAIIAVQSVGAVPVPMYQDSVAEEMAYVLGHCEAKFILAEDQEQVDKVLEIRKKLSRIEYIIYIDPRGMRKYDTKRLLKFDDVIALGKDKAGKHGDALARRIAAGKGSDTCAMPYTSGTTGQPKGVVLSHANVVWAGRTANAFDSLSEKDNVLAYLPMAWVGDFIFSVGQAGVAGFCVSCPESADTMQHDLREVGPTYFFAPPRYFEGLLTTVTIRMEDAGAFKRRMYKYFMEHARKVGGRILDGGKVSPGDRLKYRLGELLVYGPLRNTLGLSRVRAGYTAGEAIGPEIFEFYRAIGINLKQLYGQTEASVFITQQPDGEVRSDTVGIPVPGVEIRVDDTGEVKYRSPGVFVEYYKNPQSTKRTKDAQGWVATGDAGYIEKTSGHLRIIDRAGDVGKLQDGGMFAPKYVENKLKFYPNILEAVLFGAGREFCTAFINIDLQAVGNWAERNNIAYSSYQELAGHRQVYAMIEAHVREVNESLAKDEMLSGCLIRRFLILHKELDADDGELTRTRKVRRNIIAEKYADLITALYDGSDSIYTETEVTYEDGKKGVIAVTLEIRDIDTQSIAKTPAQAAE